ncbi:MAG: XTP/dITP diphosphatase [Deltaproteobacteria bacterium]
MIIQLVLATKNEGKAREFADLLKPIAGRVLSLIDINFAGEVIEDGLTFRENALKKARAIRDFSAMPALADDSGLEVEALGGRPGALSARYAGAGASDKSNIEKLLGEMRGISNRRARFACSLVLALPDGRELVAEATCEGVIAHEPRGAGGFGYDPIFFIPHLQRTMAEMIPEEKNIISHRARAVEGLIALVRNIAGEKYFLDAPI